MSAPKKSSRTAYTALALAALASALFVAGTGRALAPDLPAACVPDVPLAAEDAAQPLDAGQRALARLFARRYQVAEEATGRWVAVAYRSAAEVGLDPLLVLAVISVESRFNPVAQSVMGAKGLMQIIPKFHLDKLEGLGGEDAALDPETNILVGSRILQEYVYRTGTLEAGLQYYNGAMSDESALYARKVLAERGRLELALRAALKSARNTSANETQGS